MKQKVFISYASQDRAFAEILKSRLGELLPEHAKNAEIYDVQSSFTVGEDIRKSIKNAMEASSTVVIVSSDAGDSSQWVNYEAGLADALGKHLVIVGMKNVTRSVLWNRFRDIATFFEINKNINTPIIKSMTQTVDKNGDFAKEMAFKAISAAKSSAGSAVAKKPVAKKAVAKKPMVKKAVAKKPVAKKAVAKKPVVKKAVTKKPVAKKAASKANWHL
jgi:hypothetical protein